MPGAISLLEIFKILTPHEINRLTIKRKRVSRSLIEEAEEIENLGAIKFEAPQLIDTEEESQIEEITEEELFQNKAKILSFERNNQSQLIDENETKEEFELPLASGGDIQKVLRSENTWSGQNHKSQAAPDGRKNYTDKKLRRFDVSTDFILNEKKKIDLAEKKLSLHRGVSSYQKMNVKESSGPKNSDGPYKGVLLNKKQF